MNGQIRIVDPFSSRTLADFWTKKNHENYSLNGRLKIDNLNETQTKNKLPNVFFSTPEHIWRQKI